MDANSTVQIAVSSANSTLTILILSSIIAIAALAFAGWKVKQLINEYRLAKVPDEVYQSNIKALREALTVLKNAAEKQKLLSIDGLTIEAMREMQETLDKLNSTVFSMKNEFSQKNPFSNNNKGGSTAPNGGKQPQSQPGGNGQQHQQHQQNQNK